MFLTHPPSCQPHHAQPAFTSGRLRLDSPCAPQWPGLSPSALESFRQPLVGLHDSTNEKPNGRLRHHGARAMALPPRILRLAVASRSGPLESCANPCRLLTSLAFAFLYSDGRNMQKSIREDFTTFFQLSLGGLTRWRLSATADPAAASAYRGCVSVANGLGGSGLLLLLLLPMTPRAVLLS